jgi:hypothetical protein
MRHLSQDEAVAALRRGKTIEQLLESAPHDGRATVTWVSASRSGDAFVVRAHHVYDEGEPEFRDVSEFAPVDDEEYAGEGIEVARHLEPERALDAARVHGATAERWVNQGVVAVEYAEVRGWS